LAEVARQQATFEFETDGPPWKGTVAVNGHRVMNAASFDVHLDCESVPVVTLNLLCADALRLAFKDAALVRLGDETRDGLVSLGWTPPPGEGGQRQRIALRIAWSEDGTERAELFGPWVSGEDQEDLSHVRAALAFAARWRDATGLEPADVTAIVLNDPDGWLAEQAPAAAARPCGTECDC